MAPVPRHQKHPSESRSGTCSTGFWGGNLRHHSHNFGQGVVDLQWGHMYVSSAPISVSPMGCCGFVVTAVTNAVHAGPPIHHGEFLYVAPRCRC
jgi:hypothetical protein